MNLKFWKTADPSKKSGWQVWILVAGAALGILLLVTGGSGGTASKKEERTQESTDLQSEMLLYQAHLEEKIRKLCQSVPGVSDASVIVTLSGSFSSVYATEFYGDDVRYVVLGNGASEKPLFLSSTPPKILGVGIVCRGGESVTVQKELTDLLSASLDLPSNRIHVSAK